MFRKAERWLFSAPEPLTAVHDVTNFNCGKPSLDHWLKTRALANQSKGFAAVLWSTKPAALPVITHWLRPR